MKLSCINFRTCKKREFFFFSYVFHKFVDTYKLDDSYLQPLPFNETLQVRYFSRKENVHELSNNDHKLSLKILYFTRKIKTKTKTRGRGGGKRGGGEEDMD